MAEHMTVCGGHLEAGATKEQVFRLFLYFIIQHFFKSKFIFSIKTILLFSHAKYGDITYENKVDCDWIIEASQGQMVRLWFTTFELEGEQDCGYDHVEVRLYLILILENDVKFINSSHDKKNG